MEQPNEELLLAKYLESLASLRPDIFERFVSDILSKTGRFSDMIPNARIGPRQVDIYAVEANPISPSTRKWAFEIKPRKLITLDVIDAVIGKKLSILAEDPNINFVLVTSGNLTTSARDRASNSGLEVWDGLTLAGMTPQDVADTYFSGLVTIPVVSNNKDTKADSLIESLNTLTAGKRNWSEYQRLTADILEYVFCPPLEPPRLEFSDTDSRNRRDMIFENSANDVFWSQLRNTYAAHYIVADAKNYVDSLNKKPVLDIAHYLKSYGCGLFGVLVCRQGAGQSALHAIREQWIGGNKMIVVLSDADIIEMIRIKSDGGKPEEIIRKAIADFRMSL